MARRAGLPLVLLLATAPIVANEPTGSHCLMQRASTRHRSVVAELANGSLPELVGDVEAGLASQWTDATFTSAPIYVQPQWGLANRLRTITGAWTVGRAFGRNVVVIWNPDVQCPQNLTDLFEGIAVAASPPPDAVHLHHEGFCEYRESDAQELMKVPSNVPIYVMACDFVVGDSNSKRFEAYHALRLQAALRGEVGRITRRLRSRGEHAVGVHIRQGSLEDARGIGFFGHFKIPAGLQEVPCCAQDAPKWACPVQARPLEMYLGELSKRSANGTTNGTSFFIAADRPSCVRALEEHAGNLTIVHSQEPTGEAAGKNNASSALLDLFGLAACHEMVSFDPGSWGAEVRAIHGGLDVEAMMVQKAMLQLTGIVNPSGSASPSSMAYAEA